MANFVEQEGIDVVKNESFILGLKGLAKVRGEKFARGDLLTALINRAATSGGEMMVASLVDTDHTSTFSHWLRCDNDAYLRIGMIAGRSLASHNDRIEDVADALDTAEPLLAAIEASSGILLEPVELCDLPNETFVMVLVSRTDVSDQVYIAIPQQSKLWSHLESVGQSIGIDYSEVSVLFDLDLQAVRLNFEEVAGLGNGDLLLLGTSSVAASLTWASETDDVSRIDGCYDFRCGRFTVSSHGLSPTGYNDRQGEMGAAAIPPADFAVPVTVRLAGWNASAGDLASLKENGTLDLAVAETRRAASIFVGESILAAGTLVRVADQAAILIDRRIEVSEKADAAKMGAIA